MNRTGLARRWWLRLAAVTRPRTAGLRAELAGRVRRTDALTAELALSRQRLAHAREVERRRLATELAGVTTDRLMELRAEIGAAQRILSYLMPADVARDAPSGASPADAARDALSRARMGLDELLDRFRVIARGVYPAVLRDQGPFCALDELVTDLPRSVRLTGDLPGRLGWEIESGLYYPAAAAVCLLAGRPSGEPLRVHLAHSGGRLQVQITDPASSRLIAALRAALRDGAERLAALGGDLTLDSDSGGGIGVCAWLPDRLEPTVDPVMSRLSSTGPSARAKRLHGELVAQHRVEQARAADIAAARRQAVAEMDSERRMIERDLHDGAQHHLVSLRLALGLVEHEVAAGRPERAREQLAALAVRVDTAEAVLARTASGPPAALVECGLAAALTTELAGTDPPVVVQAPDGARFPAEVETAVYFCCLEAVNNARKHAPGAAVLVRVWVIDGDLRFTIRDNGPGFASGVNSAGRGLRNIAGRIAGVAGAVSIDSEPGAGTVVRGTVALPPAAARPPSAQRPTAEVGDTQPTAGSTHP